MIDPGLWFRAFLLTVAIEGPLVLALTGHGGRSWRRRAPIVVAAQLMTHPLVWYVFPFLPGLSRSTTFVTSELFAWAAEAALYAVAEVAPTALRAVAVSALANGASLAIGYVFF
jgi:hypothetical protein